MGMQEYYFRLHFRNKISGKFLVQDIKKSYSVSKFKAYSNMPFDEAINDVYKFIVDKKANIFMYVNDSGTKVSIQLCFSNYTKNIQFAFNLAKIIAETEKDTIFIAPFIECNFNELNEKQFENLLYESHKAKLVEFVKKYGVLKKDILPQHFYAWINLKQIFD